MGENVFTYGTLMFTEVMEAVTGRRFPSEEATLRGYSRYGLRDLVYPGIVKDTEGMTDGMMYRDVDALSLKYLHAFEDELYRCERHPVVVEQRMEPALVYVVKTKWAKKVINPIPWSPNDFWREHQDAYIASCMAFRQQMSDSI